MSYTSRRSGCKGVVWLGSSHRRRSWSIWRSANRITNGHGQGLLPGEQALAVQHGVSRVTVRRALAELEKEGLVTRRQGAGTFAVYGEPKPIVADLSNVLANIVAMGRETAVRLLEFSYREPPATIAEALKLAPGEKTQFSVRVRLIDGQPFAHLTPTSRRRSASPIPRPTSRPGRCWRSWSDRAWRSNGRPRT